MKSTNASSDWRSTGSIQTLQKRAELLRKSRSFFDDRGFFEVQTPLLSADTVVDRHLDPVPVSLPSDPLELDRGTPMWLQTSPEFAMKRILASGAQAIYEITPAFRVGEVGDFHNPEFTMLEWYRVGDSIDQGMDLLSEFVAHVLDCPPANRITVSQAFQNAVGVDPLSLDASELRSLCDANNVEAPTSLDPDDWDTWFDLLFTDRVQPTLGIEQPIVMHDYPASQAALAKIRDGEPPVAERFELFYRGTELANGYHELLDADELMQRNVKVNEERRRDGKAALPESSQLLAAMKHGLPACSGVALGFDRLVMLSTGARTIAEVLAFPTDRA